MDIWLKVIIRLTYSLEHTTSLLILTTLCMWCFHLTMLSNAHWKENKLRCNNTDGNINMQTCDWCSATLKNNNSADDKRLSKKSNKKSPCYKNVFIKYNKSTTKTKNNQHNNNCYILCCWICIVICFESLNNDISSKIWTVDYFFIHFYYYYYTVQLWPFVLVTFIFMAPV